MDQLAARYGQALRVVPQPGPLGDHRGGFDFGLHLRVHRRAGTAGGACAPRPGVDLALHDHDLVRLEKQARLLEHAREEHDIDRSRQVLERRVGHDLPLAGHDPPHLADQSRDAHLGVLQGAGDLHCLSV